jgi:DNA-binding beta-propeller fold protein YncE
MRKPALVLVAVFGLGLLSSPALLQEKGGDYLTGPYEVIPNWSKVPREAGYIQGSQAGVFAETPNRIFLVERGELKIPDGKKLPNGVDNVRGFWGLLNAGPANSQRPLMRNAVTVVDANGNLIEAWTQWDHLFAKGSGRPDAEGRQHGPHSAAISPYDPERHVWVIDDKSQQVFKFTNDGKKLVMTVGIAQEKGNDDKHLGGSTDIAWLPDGSFVLSDGYDNSRVVKFDKNGKYLMAWGKPGRKEPFEFSTPHSIATDKNRRIYVADRGNNRIQIFDENGKFLDMWSNITAPCHIAISGDQHLIVGTLGTNKMLKYDLNGKLIAHWGTYGTAPGTFNGIHGFATDTDGNLFVSETFGGRVQKFRPKPGADKTHLIGPPVPLMPKVG